MHYNSYNRSALGTPGIFLVGPPRLRAVRAQSVDTGAGGIDDEMEGMDIVCFDLDAEDSATGGEDSWFVAAAPWFMGVSPEPEPEPQPPPSPNTNITLKYKTGAELGERSYVSITGSQYPAGGMVVQNTSRLYKDYPSLKSRGCMRTCGSHMRTDVSELLDAGWLHPTSKIVILPRFACCPSR